MMLMPTNFMDIYEQLFVVSWYFSTRIVWQLRSLWRWTSWAKTPKRSITK